MRTLLLLVVAAPLVAQDAPSVKPPPPTGFVDRTIAVGGVEHRYVVYVPPEYSRDAERRWPLLMFLNGMGECGTDGRKQIEVGLAPAITKSPERWPFVVVFPQKPDKPSQWSDHEALVMGTLAATEKQWRIDGKRRFLTGLSQGGAGTWALGEKHKDVWAAIAPVCGYGKPADVAAGLRAMPIWAFHGLDDKTVPAQQSKDLCAAVAAAGGSPILTLYAKTAHNSWDKAYRESGLAEWLRMVVDAPVGARYLAEPESLASMKLTIARRRSAGAGGEVESGVCDIEAKGDSIGLGVTRPGEATVSTSASSHTSSWRDNDVAARQMVHDPLHTLHRAGLFRRPTVAQPADVDAPGHRVDLVLDGKSGPWRFHGFVPAAEPGTESLRAALDKVFEFVVAELR